MSRSRSPGGSGQDPSRERASNGGHASPGVGFCALLPHPHPHHAPHRPASPRPGFLPARTDRVANLVHGCLQGPPDGRPSILVPVLRLLRSFPATPFLPSGRLCLLEREAQVDPDTSHHLRDARGHHPDAHPGPHPFPRLLPRQARRPGDAARTPDPLGHLFPLFADPALDPLLDAPRPAVQPGGKKEKTVNRRQSLPFGNATLPLKNKQTDKAIISLCISGPPGKSLFPPLALPSRITAR